MCRDCVFQITSPTKETCPWLFDDDLFSQQNQGEFEELYATYLREDANRTDVSLALREELEKKGVLENILCNEA